MALDFLHYFTILGASNVILPACAGVALSFWLVGERRAAAAFIFSAALCAVLVSAGKIGFIAMRGWGPLYSPSGHAALACFFFGSLGGLAASSRLPLAYAIAAIAWSIAVLVFFNRFLVGGHTFADAVAGACIGSACSAIFFRLARSPGSAPRFFAIATPVALAASYASSAAFGPNISERSLLAAAFWLRGNLGL